MDKKHCVDCESNFYNGNNPLGVKECWHLKDAKVVTRFCIGNNVLWTHKENFVRVQVPSCYSKSGYCYLSELPEHLR